MFDKAKTRGVISHYTQSDSLPVVDPSQMPYFDGDVCSSTLENKIIYVNNEEEEAKSSHRAFDYSSRLQELLQRHYVVSFLYLVVFILTLNFIYIWRLHHLVCSCSLVWGAVMWEPLGLIHLNPYYQQTQTNCNCNVFCFTGLSV